MLPFGKIFQGYADAAYRRGQRDALVFIRGTIDKLLEEDRLSLLRDKVEDADDKGS